MNRLTILTAADANYVPFLGTLLYSLAAHGEQSVELKIIVLYRGILEKNLDRLERLVTAPHQILWMEVNEALCKRYGAPAVLACLPPNYFRLLAPHVCSGEQRAVHLDADTIVMGDLGPLSTCSLNGCAIGAVVDWLPHMRDAVSNWRELRIDGDAPYFNSGVLVMNLDLWRQESIAQRALDACRQNSQHLLAKGRWAQHEQYGLNVAVRGRWHQLPAIWNHFTELSVSSEAPNILHYVGQGKPGSARCLPEFTALFKRILSNTPWGNYPLV